MTSRIPSLVLLTAAALAGGAALVASEAVQAEESVPEKVERLFGDLGSDRDEVRERAETELFALGEPARRELERISRDADPRRAITALRLLTRDEWDRAASGEEKARPERGGRESVPPSLRDFEADLDRRMGDMRRQVDDMMRRLHREMPDWDMPDWPRSFEFGIDDGSAPGGVSSGKVVTGDRSLSWSVDEQGRVKVTTKDGKEAPETTVEAESMDALRKSHPEVAKRLDEVFPRAGSRRWVFRVPDGVRGWSPWRKGELDDGRDERGRREDAPLLPETPAVRPALGIEWQPVPDVLREHLDLGDGGLVVDVVLPDTLAARLGLRRHDVLLEIEGRRIGDAADVREAVEAVKPGDAVRVTIVRKGKRETVSAAR